MPTNTSISVTTAINTGGAPKRHTPLPHQERIPKLRTRRGRYVMHFATTTEEREAALRLRFHVFHLELGEGDPSCIITGLDQDPFDDQCQHLLVIDTTDGAVIGTYRMQTFEAAQAAQGFYTDLEFDLCRLGDEFAATTVELGRACVDLDHRNKAVLFLLWQGLTAYQLFHGKAGFFGCSSLTSQNMEEGLRLYEQLKVDGHVHSEMQTRPRADWRCLGDPFASEPVKIPRLFRAYLRQGAKILSPPAIDRGFGTIDFLTYVHMTDELVRRYSIRGR